jgi:hypothetical protein
MNIRPFTDALRRKYGRQSFVTMFDTVAGGGGRHVRFGMLISPANGDKIVQRTTAAAGDRWLQIDLHADGDHSAWHFVVTRNGPIPAGNQGPRFMRASTLPTPFTNPDGMHVAISHEIARNDHPNPEYDRDNG